LEFCNVIPVTTFNDIPLFTVIVPEVLPNVTELQLAATLTVTVIPILITTSFTDVGTEAPPQVAVLSQFPVTDAVLICAWELAVIKTANSAIQNHLDNCNFLFMLYEFLNFYKVRNCRLSIEKGSRDCQRIGKYIYNYRINQFVTVEICFGRLLNKKWIRAGFQKDDWNGTTIKFAKVIPV